MSLKPPVISLVLAVLAVLIMMRGTPVSAQTKNSKTAAPRAAMNLFVRAVQTKNIAALSKLISSEGALYTGLDVQDERDDLTKNPKTCWSAEVLFKTDRKGFNPARDFPKIQWVWTGNRFIASRDNKKWKKTEVYVRWKNENGVWKFCEVGTPFVGGDLG